METENEFKNYTDKELEQIARSLNGLSKQIYRDPSKENDGHIPFGDE